MDHILNQIEVLEKNTRCGKLSELDVFQDEQYCSNIPITRAGYDSKYQLRNSKAQYTECICLFGTFGYIGLDQKKKIFLKAFCFNILNHATVIDLTSANTYMDY